LLVYLKVSNMAVIESAELDFGSGFICLTGETGAGKSLIVDALGALSGQRVSGDWVRGGQKKAVIEAVFEVVHPDQRDDEYELLQDGELILRREIPATGRSRAYVNGVQVPGQLMQHYASLVFEIHGQHGQQALLKESSHRGLFDQHAGLTVLTAELEQHKSSFLAKWKSYWESLRLEQEHRKQLDFLEHQIEEIRSAELNDRDLELDDRLKRAENAELIFSLKQELRDLLENTMEPSQHRLVSILEKLVSFESDLKPFQEQLLGFQVVLTELNREISAHLFEEMDEGELVQLRKRQSVLNQLFLKYGVNLEAVQQEHQRLILERERIQSSIGSLEGRWEELTREYARLLNRKSKLDQMRRKKSRAFEQELEHVLRKLSFPHARMVTRWRVSQWPAELPSDPGLSLPRTQLTFMFSPNPGEEPRPLHKVASGGELSRVMLALIVSLNREEGKTLVFDEVDAGLGGETASAVGEILSSLGQNNQVLCVTHLAQVAQFASTHWRVLKETDSHRTVTSFHRLSGESRIGEIARLMGGDASAQGLKQHAQNMLRKCGMGG